MNKWVNIIVSIFVSTFIGVNMYLLFSDKSTIAKQVYVSDFERMNSADHQLTITKRGLIAPENIYTVYVNREDTVDMWQVKEGDVIQAGAEIATLKSDKVKQQIAIWEAEQTALEQQRSDIQQIISDLQASSSNSDSDSSSYGNENNSSSDGEIQVNVDVQVDVKQDGAFSHAIAQAEQNLADIDRKLIVLRAQLEQDDSNLAIISPVEGTIAKVRRHGAQLAVDIYSAQQILITYAMNDDWQLVANGDRVIIQGDGQDKVLRGSVLSVSHIPAENNDYLKAYKKLDPQKVENPLSYYQVSIVIEDTLAEIPFGNDMNAVITVDEALDTISVKEPWIHDRYDNRATMWRLNDKGNATKALIDIQFISKTRAVVSEGLKLGNVVLYDVGFEQYAYEPSVFLSLRLDSLPDKREWRTFGWKNYVKYIIGK